MQPAIISAMENRIWWFHYYSSKKHKHSSSWSMAWIGLMQLKWQSIMNISPTLSSSNWRLSKSFFAANLMTKPKFQLINLSCSPRPQHIQTSTSIFGHQVYLVLCQHLRKVDVIEPFQKGFDPTNLTAFFGAKSAEREENRPGQEWPLRR